MLRIGCVKYLNARPLIHGWEGEVDFDHPSALCNKLAAGELDVALVSSFEFLRNPIYRIVDDVSISSDGPVYSVVVAHRSEIDQIEEIELDPASETSVNLLRCLIAELGLNPRLVRLQHGRPGPSRPVELKDRPCARLLDRRSSHLFPPTVTRMNFLSGTSENNGRNLSDFRLCTLSGLFALKSPIQNKSQTACAICAIKTFPISMT